MDTLKTVVLVCAALVSAPVSSFAQTWTDFQVGALTRKALVYVPAGISKPPLLISLHGMGIGAGWHQGGMMKFEPIADREKFIVVYPEADQDLRWDLGGTHDIEFIEAIIDDMSAKHDIDLNRVYASGFSMGGMFSYTLACKIPDKIAAIAPGNGYPLGGLFGCVDSRPVPIFHMHGTADDFVAYSGIHAFLQTRRAAYGCPDTAVRTEPYPTTSPGSQSFKESWGPCTNSTGQQSEVILISVTGMIHDWATAGKANANEDPAFTGKPFDIDGSEEAWAYLKTQAIGQDSGGTGGTGGMDGTAGQSGAGVAGTGGATGGTGGVGPLTGGSGGMQDGSAGFASNPPIAGSGGTAGWAAPNTASPRTDDETSSGCSVRAERTPGSALVWLGPLVMLGWLLRRRAVGRRTSLN